MRIAYIECFSGMSGDMFLAALVDAGVPARVLEETVAALGVGARLEISRVLRSGISAAKVDVWVEGQKDLPREAYWERREQSEGHSQEHAHAHHSHSHDDQHETERASRPLPHEHGHSHEHSHGRGLLEIRQIISAAAISE